MLYHDPPQGLTRETEKMMTVTTATKVAGAS